MKGIIFDIKGEFAHFRKFYTNSSSLSYTVPPRTTLMGMIAGIMGEERDTYYQSYASDKLHISVQKNNPTRSMFQTLNYIKATSVGELAAPSMHTQIPFEVLRGKEDKVSFRVYVASEDTGFINILEQRFKTESYVYPPSLGTVFFQADICFKGSDLFEKVVSNKKVVISSVIPASSIEKLDFEACSIVREKMPRDFGKNREIIAAVSYLIEANGAELNVVLKENYYCAKQSNLCLMFM